MPVFFLPGWFLAVLGILLIIAAPIVLITRLLEAMKCAGEERRWREDAERRCHAAEAARTARIESILRETDPDKLRGMLWAEYKRIFDTEADSISGISSIVYETDRDRIRAVLEPELGRPFARAMLDAEIYRHNLRARQKR